MDMKLNKYIYTRLMDMAVNDDENGSQDITEEEIEQWIKQWYWDIFTRDAPMWLAGDRWYDRRNRLMKYQKEEEKKEAAAKAEKEAKKAEERSYEKDGV